MYEADAAYNQCLFSAEVYCIYFYKSTFQTVTWTCKVSAEANVMFILSSEGVCGVLHGHLHTVTVSLRLLPVPRFLTCWALY